MDLNLKDKIVFLTGGTGDIGKEIVRAYIEEGAIVCFLYHQAEKKAAELAAAYGKDRCIGYRASILDRPTLAAITREIFETYSRIDILVNNAGITDLLPFPLIDEEDWDECMDVNTKGTFLVTKEVSRYMLKNRDGSIINIGSLAGERILEVPVHYATAKAALTGFTLALTKEFSRYNIRVNCVAPGLIDGGVGRSATKKQKDQYLEFCTAKRMGRAEEVAALIVFLSSPRAAYINGQIIHIDGGI